MKYVFVIVLLISAFLITSCRPAPQPEPTPSAQVSGKITFAGSTTVQPLAHELGQAFQQVYPEVELDIAAGGSKVGIQAIHEGTVDIGMASRALHPEEAEGITPHQIAVDVIAVVVHSSNPVEALTMEELQAIYAGQITNWQAVGGSDSPITVGIRGKNSGTRGAFDEIVLDDQEPSAPNIKTAVTAGDMAALVIDDPNAIGYVGFGNLEPEIKLVAIDGVDPSEESARDGSYNLTRPLLLLTGPLTQPLGRLFVDFALSEDGQNVVSESGWVPAN
jgi:phosphate transport system substrate-binding protein